MEFIDSHCHLHDSEFYDDETREAAYTQALDDGIAAMICVGTDLASSRQAVEFAHTHPAAFALVGVHPHEARHGIEGIEQLLIDNKHIVGIGEIGLDYYYTHSPREVQQQVLRQQLELAVKYNLPVSFHVRDAFDDFWPIYDEFSGVRGVLHSFTDTSENLQKALERDLYIGINGIMSFTRDESQREMYQQTPLERVLVETDAPFLTPKPFRGKMNVPAYVSRVAEHFALLKGVSLDIVAKTTTHTTRELFGI